MILHVGTHVCIITYMYVLLHTYMYVYTYIHTYIHVCMYVCMYVHSMLTLSCIYFHSIAMRYN